MLSVDLNSDLGEGFPHDADLMTFISSANIACGYHAGDPDTMRQTVERAMQQGVAVGAHPSYPDRQNFGRRQLDLPIYQITEIIGDQLHSLSSIAQAVGSHLAHVKLHGALYNRAAEDLEFATAICQAIKIFDAGLIIYGLSGSAMIRAGIDLNLETCSEVFADRTYQEDGRLTPRSVGPASMIGDPVSSLHQVLYMLEKCSVKTGSGKEVSVLAQTICIHGDGPQAVALAKSIRVGLLNKGIIIAPPARRIS